MSIDNITRHKKIFNSYEEMDEFVTENEGRTIEIFGYTSMTCVEDMSTKYVLLRVRRLYSHFEKIVYSFV